MWNETCAKIFIRCTKEFEKNNIHYFVLRNHEGLPYDNASKDVDIMIEPEKIKKAKEIVKSTYRDFGLIYYDEAIFHRLNCTHGINKEKIFGIHIDLLEGYFVRGYEVYTFEQLYKNTELYNGFYVLNEFYQGIMLFITKIFGYKKAFLNETYQMKIVDIYTKYEEQFERELRKIFSKEKALKYNQAIRKKDFKAILSDREDFDRQLKSFARKNQPVKTIKNNIVFLWGRFCRIVVEKNKYKRVIGIVSNNNEMKTRVADKIARQLNEMYADEEKTHLYKVQSSTKRNRLKKKLTDDVHYDKTSIILTEQKSKIEKIVPDAMIFILNEKDDAKGVEKKIINKYMETYLEKIG